MNETESLFAEITEAFNRFTSLQSKKLSEKGASQSFTKDYEYTLFWNFVIEMGKTSGQLSPSTIESISQDVLFYGMRRNLN